MVQCKCCSSDKLDFTTKEVNSILRDGVINVSLRYREGYWDPIDQLTLEEAIEKVPQDYRSPLRIIQFLNKEGYNEMWTWRGTDVEKEWSDVNFWVKSTDDNTVIDEVHLKDGSVTNPKIASAAVTESKIADGSISTRLIKNGAVATEKIADSAVTESKIADSAVTADKIAANAVVTSKIADGSVTNPKIASAAVTESKIADGSISTRLIKNGAVTLEKLSQELQDNLAHKATVFTYGSWFQDYDKIPEIIKQYKADENKSVFLVQKDGMYFPAQLLYNQGSEAIVFFQPEGTNLRKYILRATGREEVLIYGDTVRYNKQSLTDSQKQQARENIEAMPDITIDLDAIEGVWDDTFGPTDFAYPYNDLDDSKYDTKRKVVMDYISNKLTEMGLLHTEGENSQILCIPYGYTLHFRLTTKVDEGLLSFYADNVVRMPSTDLVQWGLRFSCLGIGTYIDQDPVKGLDYGAYFAGIGFGVSAPMKQSMDVVIACSGEAEFVRNNVMSALQACRPLCLAVAEDIYTDEEKEKGREILNTIDKAAFLTDAEVNDIWDNN